MTSSPSRGHLTARAPIAVALDAPDLVMLEKWVEAVAPFVTTVKVGLEVFCRDGARAVHAARRAATSAPNDPGSGAIGAATAVGVVAGPAFAALYSASCWSFLSVSICSFAAISCMCGTPEPSIACMASSGVLGPPFAAIFE